MSVYSEISSVHTMVLMTGQRSALRGTRGGFVAATRTSVMRVAWSPFVITMSPKRLRSPYALRRTLRCCRRSGGNTHMHIRTLAIVAAAAATPALAVVGLRPIAMPVAAVTSSSSPSLPFDAPRELTVTGEAVADVVPDRATVHFAVDVVHAATAAAASLEASQRTAKILKAAEAAGVEPASVKTDALNVTAEMNHHKDGTSDVVGFTASRGITVCI